MTVLILPRPRQDLAPEKLLLRHQLAVLTRPTRTRPGARLRTWDKLVWVLVRRFCAGWREHLTFVTPETVVRWHRQGWRLFWRWKSRSGGGRPHLSPEIRELIVTTSRENRLWGIERIRGELLSWGWWSAIVRFGATAGADRDAGRARPGAPSWPTMPITSGLLICSPCPPSRSRRCTCVTEHPRAATGGHLKNGH
jgi:hypothetical protein